MRALREGVIVGLANHTVLIKKDGSEQPIDDSAAPIRDELGSVIGCVLIFRDISERRKAERAIRSSEARKRSSSDGEKWQRTWPRVNMIRTPFYSLAPLIGFLIIGLTTWSLL